MLPSQLFDLPVLVVQANFPRRAQKRHQHLFPSKAIHTTHFFKDDSYHQTAAGTHSNFLAVMEICETDLEFIATGTGIVVDFQLRVVGHVFDFDLVVYVLCHGEGIYLVVVGL